VPASARHGQWIAVASVAVLTVGVWPTLFSYLSRPIPELAGTPVSPPQPRAGWAIDSAAAVWKPAFTGAASETVRTYVKVGATVQCYIAFYKHQREGRELIDYRNVIARPDDPQWRHSGGGDRRIRLGRESVVVRETDVRSPGARFLVWHWYWFPDEFTTSREWAKLLQARASLLLRRDHAAVVVLSAAVTEGRDAEGELQEFVEDMLPSIRLALHRADVSP